MLHQGIGIFYHPVSHSHRKVWRASKIFRKISRRVVGLPWLIGGSLNAWRVQEDLSLSTRIKPVDFPEKFMRILATLTFLSAAGEFTKKALRWLWECLWILQKNPVESSENARRMLSGIYWASCKFVPNIRRGQLNIFICFIRKHPTNLSGKTPLVNMLKLITHFPLYVNFHTGNNVFIIKYHYYYFFSYSATTYACNSET